MDFHELPSMSRRQSFKQEPNEDKLYRQLINEQSIQLLESHEESITRGNLSSVLEESRRRLSSRPYSIYLPISKRSFWQIEKLLDMARYFIMRENGEQAFMILCRICRVITLPVFEKKYISTLFGAIKLLLSEGILDNGKVLRIMRKLLHLSSRQKHQIQIEIARMLCSLDEVDSAYTELCGLVSDTKNDSYLFAGYFGIVCARKFMANPEQVGICFSAFKELAQAVEYGGHLCDSFAEHLLKLYRFCSSSEVQIHSHRRHELFTTCENCLKSFYENNSDHPSACSLYFVFLLEFSPDQEDAIHKAVMSLVEIDAVNEIAISYLEGQKIFRTPEGMETWLRILWRSLEMNMFSAVNWKRLLTAVKIADPDCLQPIRSDVSMLRIHFSSSPAFVTQFDDDINSVKQQVSQYVLSKEELFRFQSSHFAGT